VNTFLALTLPIIPVSCSSTGICHSMSLYDLSLIFVNKMFPTSYDFFSHYHIYSVSIVSHDRASMTGYWLVLAPDYSDLAPLLTCVYNRWTLYFCSMVQLLSRFYIIINANFVGPLLILCCNLYIYIYIYIYSLMIF